MFIDSLGLAIDDLWSYYDVLGRPAWLIVTPAFAASAALAALLLA